jgi:hypothetical protein
MKNRTQRQLFIFHTSSMTVGCTTLQQRCGALTAFFVALAAVLILLHSVSFERWDGDFCRAVSTRRSLLTRADAPSLLCRIDSVDVQYANNAVPDSGIFCVYRVSCGENATELRAVSSLDVFQRPSTFFCDPYRVSHVGASNVMVRFVPRDDQASASSQFGELDTDAELAAALGDVQCVLNQFALQPALLLLLPLGCGAMLASVVRCAFHQRRHFQFKKAQMRARLNRVDEIL